MSTSQQRQEVTVTGEVVEALPNTTFRVAYEDASANPDEPVKKEVIAYLSGKMRRFRIRVLPGDTVDVLLDGFENEKGRLTKRH